MIEFGEKLKRAREAKGMTQQTLAGQLAVALLLAWQAKKLADKRRAAK